MGTIVPLADVCAEKPDGAKMLKEDGSEVTGAQVGVSFREPGHLLVELPTWRGTGKRVIQRPATTALVRWTKPLAR